MKFNYSTFTLLVALVVVFKKECIKAELTFTVAPTNPSIAEDTAKSTSVAKITTTGGTGTNTYTLVSQTPDSTPKIFALTKDAENLEISVNDTLDFETTDNYKLIISVTDGSDPVLTGTTTVDIQITDVNEAPSFSAATYTACVSQNSVEDTKVITVTATDQDDGDTISYSLTDGNADGVFTISTTTGAITVETGETVPATPNSYSLEVTATDNDGTPLSGTTVVTVTVGNPCPGNTAAMVKGQIYLALSCVAVIMLKLISF